MLFVFSVVLAAALCVNARLHSEGPKDTFRSRTNLLDLYMFQSTTTKTVLSFTTSGFQRSDAGPNYTPTNNDLVYQLHIDNNHDAVEDLTFQFVFGHKFAPTDDGPGARIVVNGIPVPIALVAFGKIEFESNADTLNQKNLNNLEYYSVRLLSGAKYDTNIDDGPFLSAWNDESQTKFVKPVDNVGTKAFGDAQFQSEAYDDYAENFVYNQVRIPGCGDAARMFVGPRREPFSINLNLFDLFNVEGGFFEEAIVGISGVPPDAVQNPRFNSLDCNTVVAFVLEVETECLLAKTQPRTSTLQAFASVRKLEHTGVGGSFHRAGEQINRVGNPYFNEIFIGVGFKDLYARSHPKDDFDNFKRFFLDPDIPKSISVLSANVIKVPFRFSDVPLIQAPRIDILGLFLAGIAGVHYAFEPAFEAPIADMIRLNVKVPPLKQNEQSSLGILDGDFAGFPNGRRFGDDVVDVMMRALQGVACTTRVRNMVCDPNSHPTGVDLAFTCARLPATCVGPVVDAQASLHWTDRSPISAEAFEEEFPFLNAPVPGNHFIDCWRDHGIDSQFRTFADCSLDHVRRGCVDASTDLSCDCP